MTSQTMSDATSDNGRQEAPMTIQGVHDLALSELRRKHGDLIVIPPSVAEEK